MGDKDGKAKLQALREELQKLKDQGDEGRFETQAITPLPNQTFKARRQLKGHFGKVSRITMAGFLLTPLLASRPKKAKGYYARDACSESKTSCE